MRSFYKTNRQPGRNQFQYMKKIWSYMHAPRPTKIRGKMGKIIVNILMIAFMSYVGYLVYSLLTPEHGLFRVSLFHLID